MKKSLEKISVIGASFLIGVGIYACAPGTTSKITDAREKMPKMDGILKYEVTFSGSKPANKNKVYVKSRAFIKDENHEMYAFHLICNKKTEEKPYSVITSEELQSGNEKAILYLDLDRNGFIDPNGKFVGQKNFIKNHDLIGDAPECPTN